MQIFSLQATAVERCAILIGNSTEHRIDRPERILKALILDLMVYLFPTKPYNSYVNKLNYAPWYRQEFFIPPRELELVLTIFQRQTSVIKLTSWSRLQHSTACYVLQASLITNPMNYVMLIPMTHSMHERMKSHTSCIWLTNRILSIHAIFWKNVTPKK